MLATDEQYARFFCLTRQNCCPNLTTNQSQQNASSRSLSHSSRESCLSLGAVESLWNCILGVRRVGGLFRFHAWSWIRRARSMHLAQSGQRSYVFGPRGQGGRTSWAGAERASA